MKKETKGYLNIITAQVLFAFMFIFIRYVESFGVYNLAFWRVFLAAIFLFVFSLLFRRFKISVPKVEKLKLLFFGAIHGFIILAAFISIYYLTIASAMFLQATLSIWAIIFSCIILKEKIDTRLLSAVIISFSGLVIILSPISIFSERSLIGAGAALSVGIFGGLVYAISKTFKEHNSFSFTFWQNLIAIPFLVPLLFIQGPVVNAINVTFVGLIALFGTLAFIFLFFGLKSAKGSYAALLTLLNFILTIVLAIFFFGEIPSSRDIIGGMLILIGAYLVLSKK